MKSPYIGYRNIVQPIVAMALISFISESKCSLGYSSISTRLPGAVLYTVLGAICVIHYMQLDCAYMAYLLYCGITNPHWCQLCSISIWVYIVNPSGERVSNRVYSTLVYRLNVSSRYTHGNQLFSTRAHCCNQSLALSMPSTVLLALLFMIYACYDVLVCNV